MVRGFYLRFGEGVSEEANRRALALAEALLRAPLRGFWTPCPPTASSTWSTTPGGFPEGGFCAFLRGFPQERAEEGRVVEIPVRYDGEDLPEVASRLGLSLGR